MKGRRRKEFHITDPSLSSTNITVRDHINVEINKVSNIFALDLSTRPTSAKPNSGQYLMLPAPGQELRIDL